MRVSKQNTRHVPATRSAGFSLVELLVTVAIFSIGLLAVAGLQMVAKQANFESIQRSSAAQVAYGLLEDMRMNGDALATYANSADLGGDIIAAEPNPNCRSAVNVCTPAQRALHDMWYWESALDGDQETSNGNPTGGIIDPTICIAGPVAGDAGNYQVSVAWRGGVMLLNPTPNDCGSASGKYGADNAYRRVLQVATYIDPGI